MDVPLSDTRSCRFLLGAESDLMTRVIHDFVCFCLKDAGGTYDKGPCNSGFIPPGCFLIFFTPLPDPFLNCGLSFFHVEVRFVFESSVLVRNRDVMTCLNVLNHLCLKLSGSQSLRRFINAYCGSYANASVLERRPFHIER